MWEIYEENKYTLWSSMFGVSTCKAHPTFFRGMCLANPTLPPADAVSALEELHAAGFVVSTSNY